jgi:hypothetical protein
LVIEPATSWLVFGHPDNYANEAVSMKYTNTASNTKPFKKIKSRAYSSQDNHTRYMDLWKICISSLCSIDKLLFSTYFDLWLPPLFPNIFLCFSNHQRAVFFFHLLLSLPSFVLQWHHAGGNFSSEYDNPIGFSM